MVCEPVFLTVWPGYKPCPKRRLPAPDADRGGEGDNGKDKGNDTGKGEAPDEQPKAKKRKHNPAKVAHGHQRALQHKLNKKGAA